MDLAEKLSQEDSAEQFYQLDPEEQPSREDLARQFSQVDLAGLLYQDLEEELVELSQASSAVFYQEIAAEDLQLKFC